MDTFSSVFNRNKVKLIFPETFRARINLNNKLFSIHYGVPHHQTGLTDACVHWIILRDKSTCLRVWFETYFPQDEISDTHYLFCSCQVREISSMITTV